MTSIRKEYFEKKEATTNILNSLKLPESIKWKYELSPESHPAYDFDMTPKEAKAKRCRFDTMRPADVVNFYMGRQVIGRLYFVKKPPEITSLNEKFGETELLLRQALLK